MNMITFNYDPPISHGVPSFPLNTGAEPQHSSVTLRFALVIQCVPKYLEGYEDPQFR